MGLGSNHQRSQHPTTQGPAQPRQAHLKTSHFGLYFKRVASHTILQAARAPLCRTCQHTNDHICTLTSSPTPKHPGEKHAYAHMPTHSYISTHKRLTPTHSYPQETDTHTYTQETNTHTLLHRSMTRICMLPPPRACNSSRQGIQDDACTQQCAAVVRIKHAHQRQQEDEECNCQHLHSRRGVPREHAHHMCGQLIVHSIGAGGQALVHHSAGVAVAVCMCMCVRPCTTVQAQWCRSSSVWAEVVPVLF